MELGEPTTEDSRRTVPLPVPTVETLRAHRKHEARSSSPQAAYGRSSGSCSRQRSARRWKPRNVLRRFEQLAQRAGLTGVHLHTLRHSTGSLLLAAGTHTKVVHEHLGHSSCAITADIYSHVAPAQRREAADRLDAALDW